MLATDDLDYALPEELIAQHPLPQREASRMLVVDRDTGGLQDESIGQIAAHLAAGDLLILNDTRVLPAKFTLMRGTGGRVRGLFLEESAPGQWEILLEGSRRIRIGEELTATGRDEVLVAFRASHYHGAGRWRLSVCSVPRPAPTPSASTRPPPPPAVAILEQIGTTPLPPYIRRNEDDRAADASDRERYQTVYACRPGAVAAPTAGLHLTPRLLDEIRAAGVEIAFVTLHVGLGTFKPIEAPHLSEHRMHAEWFELPAETAKAVRACRGRDGRVTAVGTTVVRALESAAESGRTVRPFTGQTDIFIYPPYRFRVVDALLTNFHLPRSTLLALVMAFVGKALTLQAYRHAVDQQYRFYSFGDAMFIR